ncbi:PGF-CTERM sorting domain-containing protein [Halomicroarcula sp. GCM10025817]|uniref:DUF7345 domain-containing protein n=1 Tax=Haloarcula TaxID=2237 RepID=UPI0023E80BEF|nr:PGF-CTERM sorting domain-containing protein [Halomicroarcula sp. SYNS111]
MIGAGGQTRRRVASFALAVLLVGCLVGPVGTASGTSHAQDAFVVDLETDGSATVTLRSAFDLTTESQRAAFRELRDNETKTAALRDGFVERLRAVAAATADSTGRQMTVENATVTVDATESVGTVSLSATWTGLAAVEGDRVTLTEPFASSFDPEHRFVVTAPDGYVLSTVTPRPDGYVLSTVTPRPDVAGTEGTVANWAPNTSLDDFRVVAEPASEQTPPPQSTTGSSGPGFGVAAALGALLSAGVLARRRAQ